jgi:uncharacterized protein (DUF1330 family)
MAAYLVATVTITNPVAFGEYAKGIAGLAERFDGESIVKGMVAEFVEGDGIAGERVVVTRFPDIAAAKAYLDSAQYRAAKAHREGAASVVIRLLDLPA